MELKELFDGWEGFDVLKGLFHYLPDHPVPNSIPVLHRAFRDLKNDDRFARFFEEYNFDETNYYPFCKSLQTDLMNMEQSQLLTSPNPSLTKYTVDERLIKHYDPSRNFEREEIEALEEMSRKFIELINRYDKDMD